MSGISRRITLNVIANYLGQGWSALMAVAFLPVYISAFGFESYGLIGFFTVLQSTLLIFDLGITATLTREAAHQRGGLRTKQSLRNLVRSCEYIGGVFNTLIALLVWGLADRLAGEWINSNLLSAETVVLSIALMGIVIAIRLQEGIYRGILLGIGSQVVLNVASALLATARYGGAAVVVYYGPQNIVAFFIWQVFVSLISLVVFAVLAYRRLPVTHQPQRFSLEALVSIWRFSAGMAVVAGLSILMANLDKLIFSGIFQLDEFGRYVLAATVASTLYLFVVPITQGFYPYMVAANSRGDRRLLILLHHTSSQAVTVVAGSMAILLIIFSWPLLFVWSGNDSLASEISPILSVLATAALANSLGHVGHNLQIVTGHTRSLVITGSGTVLLALFVLPLVAINHGLAEAAQVWVGIAIVQASIVLYLSHRGCVQGEGFRWLFRDVIPPLAGALATMWLFSRFIPQSDMGRLILSGYVAVTASASFVVAVWLAPNLRDRLKASLFGS
jgi:O-antigen/teichoic acid export membrane protein